MSHSCKEHGEVAFCDSCLIEAQQAEIEQLQKEKRILIDALYLKSDAVHFGEVMKSLRGEHE